MEPQYNESHDIQTWRFRGLSLQMVKWAFEECGLDLFDIEGCFGLVDRDPDDREAAAAVFWACQAACEHRLSTDSRRFAECPPSRYITSSRFHDSDPRYTDVQHYWDQMAELPKHPMLQVDAFLDWATPLATRDPFVALLWGGGLVTLMIDEARRSSDEETGLYYHEDLRRVIETTHAAGSLIDASVFDKIFMWYCSAADVIGNADHIEFSASVAMGHTGLQLGTMHANLGNLTAGFETVAYYVSSLGNAWVLVDGMFMAHLGEAFATASSRGGYSQMRAWFEHLLAEPERVQDWERIKTACWAARDGLDVETIVREGQHPDDSAYPYIDWLDYELAYWSVAQSLSEAHLSPDQLVRTLRLREQEEHRTRLETDTMYDTWDAMEARTQEALISAESAWYTSRRAQARTGSVLNELRLAFEAELRACLAPLRDPIESLLGDRELRARHRLSSRYADSLNLGDMAKLLRLTGDTKDLGALGLRSAFETLPLSDRERRLLTEELPTFIWPLWDARNVAEHEFRWNVENVARFRRRTLGIDCPGYLPALVRIKRKIKASRG